MFKVKNKKLWLISAILVLIVGIIGVIVYDRVSPKVLTKSEYIKEVIIQNKDFEKSLDKFLDQIFSYNSSKEADEKLEETAKKFSNFVKELDQKLAKRVPTEAKEHYSKMMQAYEIYIEAIELYKKATPKNFGEERNTLMLEAKNKLDEARKAMKTLE